MAQVLYHFSPDEVHGNEYMGNAHNHSNWCSTILVQWQTIDQENHLAHIFHQLIQDQTAAGANYSTDDQAAMLTKPASYGDHSFCQSSDEDGRWASVHLLGEVVGDDRGQTETALALFVDATNCDGIKTFLSVKVKLDSTRLGAIL
jgi:hypothetical protein